MSEVMNVGVMNVGQSINIHHGSALPLLSQHGPLFSQDLCKFPHVFTSYHIS